MNSTQDSSLLEPLFEIALFPIPNLVSFPGTTVSLHVFEPRYRLMIKDCVKENRRIGVCHTQKVISDPKPNQTQAEILNSNQATYEPYSIFSAGLGEISDVAPDGRMYVQISMENRFQLVQETQTLPYCIFQCKKYEDTDFVVDSQESQELQTRIRETLIRRLSVSYPEVTQLLELYQWRTMSARDFSFKVFNFLKLDPDLMQEILETQSPLERLMLISRGLG